MMSRGEPDYDGQPGSEDAKYHSVGLQKMVADVGDIVGRHDGSPAVHTSYAIPERLLLRIFEVLRTPTPWPGVLFRLHPLMFEPCWI